MKTEPRDAVILDIELGKKLRDLRLQRSISHIHLGHCLGVSFRQIQKYESGINRLSSSRLLDIAELLKVPLSHFYSTNADLDGNRSSLQGNDAATLRMLRAYSRIKNADTQRRLVELVEAIADKCD